MNSVLDHPHVQYLLKRKHQTALPVTPAQRSSGDLVARTPRSEMGLALSSDEVAALFPQRKDAMVYGGFDKIPGNKSAAAVGQNAPPQGQIFRGEALGRDTFFGRKGGK